MAKVAKYPGDPEELIKDKKSALMNFFFGEERDKSITRDDFFKVQRDLINDILFLEFHRYIPKGSSKKTISEMDFCRHLLYNTNVPLKKKEKMLKRIQKKFRGKGTLDIDFLDFKNFYYVLFGGADLERAMFFIDAEKRGVTREEFYHIAFWVAHKILGEHLIDVVFTLLDEDGDAHLSIKEFQPILFQWRHSRGFQKAALQVSLGGLYI